MRVTNSEAIIQHYISTFAMTDFLNEDLLAALQLFRFLAYNHVYIEQDEQRFLYFLVEGQVQCNHYHLNGDLAVVAVSNPFTAIGDVEILSKQKVKSNVVATKDTTMLGIASPIVERYGANDPRFLRFLIDQLREKLYRTDSLQRHQGLPVIKRLAVYILAQAGDTDEEVVVLPNKEGFASLLGTTPRHLNRVLKTLVQSGSISAGYPVMHILDKPALQDLTL